MFGYFVNLKVERIWSRVFFPFSLTSSPQFNEIALVQNLLFLGPNFLLGFPTTWRLSLQVGGGGDGLVFGVQVSAAGDNNYSENDGDDGSKTFLFRHGLGF